MYVRTYNRTAERTSIRILFFFVKVFRIFSAENTHINHEKFHLKNRTITFSLTMRILSVSFPPERVRGKLEITLI